MFPKRVLLAEDDEDDQKLFFEYLQHRNDIVLMKVAENGVVLFESLEKVKDDELPHLIILDQNMPKRNGLQTLQLLKNHKRFSHIPVMVYSTYTDDPLMKNGAAMGATAVMSKPLTQGGYNQMMDAFLKITGSV